MAGKGKMRMRADHYEHLRKHVKPVMSQDTCAGYKAKRLTFNRYIHDCLADAYHNDRELLPWLCKELYAYLNDAHIATALRAIAKEAGLQDYD